MVPDFDPETDYLQPGTHVMSWEECSFHFGFNEHRSKLLEGLLAALHNLRDAGCHSVLLNGSFVSQKEFPRDYDAVWYTVGVDGYLLDPVLLDFRDSRSAMKSKYFGELFPSGVMAAPGIMFEDFLRLTVIISRKVLFTLTYIHSHDYQ